MTWTIHTASNTKPIFLYPGHLGHATDLSLRGHMLIDLRAHSAMFFLSFEWGLELLTMTLGAAEYPTNL